MRVWGVNKDLKVEVQAIGGSVDDLDWSDDGTRLAACGDGRGRLVKAFIWDSGSDLGEFAGLSKRVNSLAFRPKRPYRILTGCATPPRAATPLHAKGHRVVIAAAAGAGLRTST